MHFWENSSRELEMSLALSSEDSFWTWAEAAQFELQSSLTVKMER
jgi:hypothetical protein